MKLRTRDIIEQIRHGNIPDGYKKQKQGFFLLTGMCTYLETASNVLKGLLRLSQTNCTHKSVFVPMERAFSIKNLLREKHWEISLSFGLSRTAL